MMRAMKWAAAAALSATLAVSAWAADANGKWTWKTMIQQNEVVQTLELKVEGEKLTGTITGRNNQKIEIKDGTVKNDEVSFTVIRSRGGQEIKTLYKGKVEGDTIKGKTTFTRDGQERSRDWNATRVK